MLGQEFMGRILYFLLFLQTIFISYFYTPIERLVNKIYDDIYEGIIVKVDRYDVVNMEKKTIFRFRFIDHVINLISYIIGQKTNLGMMGNTLFCKTFFIYDVLAWNGERIVTQGNNFGIYVLDLSNQEEVLTQNQDRHMKKKFDMAFLNDEIDVSQFMNERYKSILLIYHDSRTLTVNELAAMYNLSNGCTGEIPEHNYLEIYFKGQPFTFKDNERIIMKNE